MQASSFGKYIDEEAFKNSFVQQSLDDLYVEKDKGGKVLTLIKCGDPENPIARKCEQEFVLNPEMRARVTTIFQSVHLQDWKTIQLKAKKVVQGFIVKPIDIKGK